VVAVTNVSKIITLALGATGSIAALARALNVAPSHVSRMRKGLVGVGPEGSLRLSFILGRTALGGLREDGHGELADLLEAFFEIREDKRAVARRALDADVDALPAQDFRHIRAVITSLANAARRSANAPNPIVSGEQLTSRTRSRRDAHSQAPSIRGTEERT
jgi:hypothetical protein